MKKKEKINLEEKQAQLRWLENNIYKTEQRLRVKRKQRKELRIEIVKAMEKE